MAGSHHRAAGYPRAVAIDPLNPSSLYAVSSQESYGTGYYHGMIDKITNGGDTWQNVFHLTNSIVRTVAIDPLNPATFMP